MFKVFVNQSHARGAGPARFHERTISFPGPVMGAVLRDRCECVHLEIERSWTSLQFEVISI